MMRRPKVMANHFTHHRGPRRWELRAVRMACVSVGTVAVMSTLLRRGRPGEEAALDGAEQDVHEQAEDSCHDDRGVEGENVVALRPGGGEDAADYADSAAAEAGDDAETEGDRGRDAGGRTGRENESRGGKGCERR